MNWLDLLPYRRLWKACHAEKLQLFSEAQRRERELLRVLSSYRQPAPSVLYKADDLPADIRGTQGLGQPDGSTILDPRAPIYAFSQRMRERRLARTGKPDFDRYQVLGGMELRYPRRADWERLFEAIKPNVLAIKNHYNLCRVRTMFAVGLAQQAGWEQFPVAIAGTEPVWDASPHAVAIVICYEGVFLQDFTPVWQFVDIESSEGQRYVPFSLEWI